ncbi:MAG: membrane protein insertion efficiency factor YidD [Alphaproteobacteria bacterium]|nr:membrane protein insertion efficiency factor YidD [Alphaproteobacteria bacterium]
MMKKIGVVPFLAGIKLYRWFLSPLLGGRCRFQPTCSEYAEEAFSLHGARKGAILTAKRILKCHPWGGSGYDPVPPKAEKRKK